MTLIVLPQPAAATQRLGRHVTFAPVLQRGEMTFLSGLSPLAHDVDPVAFLAAGSARLGDSAFFWQPRPGKALVGLGEALIHQASGPDRFRSLVTALEEFSAALNRSDRSPFPIFAGGAFHDHVDADSIWRDFPAAACVVPSVVLQKDETGVALRVTISIGEDTPIDAAEEELQRRLAQATAWSECLLPTPIQPFLIDRTGDSDRPAWEAAVARGVEKIRQQQLQKVVIARQEHLEASDPFSPFQALDHLRAVNPNATLFAIRQGTAWFLGASPERLVRLRNGVVDVSCLAGSIGLGNSDAERRKLAAELLRSKKDRLEHELVVGPIMQSLQDVCDEVIRLPGTPRVVPARSVQHLETPITARLKGSGHVLDLVERLHPTPAVGGYPRHAALQAMNELERIERGWYAGPFGWTDLEGKGEFIVALRSALLDGTSATLFAGCGVVEDSIPAREFEESRLKMRPMLAALGAE